MLASHICKRVRGTRCPFPLTALSGEADPDAEGALPVAWREHTGPEPRGLLELEKGSKELERRINNNKRAHRKCG